MSRPFQVEITKRYAALGKYVQGSLEIISTIKDKLELFPYESQILKSNQCATEKWVRAWVVWFHPAVHQGDKRCFLHFFYGGFYIKLHSQPRHQQ